MKQVDDKDFNQAYEALDIAEEKMKDKITVRKMRASVCFRHGLALSQEGNFREALIHGKQAQQLNPEDEDVYKSFVQQMEEMAPEEDNLRLIKQVEEARENEKFDLAIQYAQRVPKSSQHFEYARQLQAKAHFQRGITTANKGNLIKGEEDLRHALKICTDADVQKKIKEQLSVVLNERANELFEASKTNPASSRNETLTLLKNLLAEAVRLNDNNASARDNLKALNEALS